MSFWDYSNKVYQSTHVPEACLQLQNNHGMDVNMLLLCCWYGINYGKFKLDTFVQCHNFSRKWSDNAVKPLRNVRTWLKQSACFDMQIEEASCMEYREQVKHLELQAERLQQYSLEALCASQNSAIHDSNDQSAAIACNLKIYLEAEKIQATETIICELEILAKNSISNLDKASFSKIFYSV